MSLKCHSHLTCNFIQLDVCNIWPCLFIRVSVCFAGQLVWAVNRSDGLNGMMKRKIQCFVNCRVNTFKTFQFSMWICSNCKANSILECTHELVSDISLAARGMNRYLVSCPSGPTSPFSTVSDTHCVCVRVCVCEITTMPLFISTVNNSRS